MFKKILNIIVLVGVLFGAFYVVKPYFYPCDKPLAYRLGTFDERFGISKDDFLGLIAQAEATWEDSSQKDLFVYDPNARFTVNLIFDERQEDTFEEKEFRENLDTQNDAYDQLVGKYDSLEALYVSQVRLYDDMVSSYEKRLASYTSRVEFWNSKGGAPKSEYDKLQKEQASLQSEAVRIDAKREEVNALAKDISAVVDEINIIARELNIDVSKYNDKFSEGKTFDQGNYVGNAINIYQFETQKDLLVALIHEFGHAIGLGHVDDPKAIMYYLRSDQNTETISLADADIAALRSYCKIR